MKNIYRECFVPFGGLGSKGSLPVFSSNIMEINFYSDDFRGNRRLLICFNWVNIRSKIWQQSLNPGSFQLRKPTSSKNQL